MQIDPTIFKAYDIRGVYPTTINEEIVYKIAQAYAKLINPKTVVLGHDIRISGPALFAAAKKGLVDHGVNVVEIGRISTDMMYFAAAFYELDGGLTITASHNTREYNGIKMVRAKGIPISGDSGIYEIRDLVASSYSYTSENPGSVSQKDIFSDYINKILSVVDINKITAKKIVANINFGMTGKVLKELEKRLPLELHMINAEPNGEFPKGRPDPLIPENRNETIELIKSTKPDFGVAWDADADRCFFFDENSRFLSGYFTTAVLAKYLLDRHPKSKVVVDMKLNWAIVDTVKAAGGEALPNKTGHSFFKERMIKEDAIFGGEVSAHYFFKDFFYLDNGIIPFLLMLELLSITGKKISEIYEPFFQKYYAIEETNAEVVDVNLVIEKLKTTYSDAELSFIDGISIEYPNWRANVRPSNTEPLVRLNLEARDPKTLKQKTQELLDLISR